MNEFHSNITLAHHLRLHIHIYNSKITPMLPQLLPLPPPPPPPFPTPTYHILQTFLAARASFNRALVCSFSSFSPLEAAALILVGGGAKELNQCVHVHLCTSKSKNRLSLSHLPTAFHFHSQPFTFTHNLSLSLTAFHFSFK